MTRLKPCINGGAVIEPKLWLIDMDDTLYSASENMFHEMHVRMDAYIQSALGVDAETANNLRKHYWQKYGVTFYGLWYHHKIDPHDFLTMVHQIDISSISTHGKMREAVDALPGRKVLFTNAPICYAERIIAHLGLLHAFDDCYRAEEMKVAGMWRPKPSAQMFRYVLAKHGVKPHQACLIDDNLHNLKIAKQVGMQTVLCKGWHHHGLGVVRPSNYVDACIGHLRELPRLIKKPIKAARFNKKRPIFLNPYG